MEEEDYVLPNDGIMEDVYQEVIERIEDPTFSSNRRH